MSAKQISTITNLMFTNYCLPLGANFGMVGSIVLRIFCIASLSTDPAMLYTAALRFAAETMKSMCRRQVESKLRGFGHRYNYINETIKYGLRSLHVSLFWHIFVCWFTLGPDQNGCPEDVV